MGAGLRELDELTAVGARRKGRAGVALVQLVEQVELHLDAAAERARPALERLKHLAEGQVPGGPAATRLLALELHSASLDALGPRAAKARAVAYSFHLICLVVLGLTELVIALVLFLEWERLLAPRNEAATYLLYALAFQFLFIPALLRWLERKLLWETYVGVCSDLTAALDGLKRELER